MEALQVLKYRFLHDRLDFTRHLVAREEDIGVSAPVLPDGLLDHLHSGPMEAQASFSQWLHSHGSVDSRPLV